MDTHDPHDAHDAHDHSHEHEHDPHDATKHVDLVLEGGGVKNVALLGAVLALAQAGYEFPRVAGTSGGAIIAAAVAAYQRAGLDLDGLFDFVAKIDNSQFTRYRQSGRIAGPISGIADLLREGGLHSSDYIYEILGPPLEKAGVSTFRDLRIDDDHGTGLPESQRYSLVVYVSDLTRRVIVRLPWDYPEYGRNPDEQSVIAAVQASMSIPFYFKPVKLPTEGGAVTWVDGGLLVNFPINTFDRADAKPPRWPTWGVKVSSSPRWSKDEPVRSPLRLGVRCLQTLTGDWYRAWLSEEGAGRRTIMVDTSAVASTDFNLTEKQSLQLYQNGRQAAQQFLERLADSLPATP